MRASGKTDPLPFVILKQSIGQAASRATGIWTTGIPGLHTTGARRLKVGVNCFQIRIIFLKSDFVPSFVDGLWHFPVQITFSFREGKLTYAMIAVLVHNVLSKFLTPRSSLLRPTKTHLTSM